MSEPDPTTVHGGQLLSVDMWGGEPSVVVGTGLSDDRRLRILRKGDHYNGISVQDVDVGQQSATFIGKSQKPFTLRVTEGG